MLVGICIDGATAVCVEEEWSYSFAASAYLGRNNYSPLHRTPVDTTKFWV